VFLKSLTLRGFKSFASATTLRFEPGVTCVVGPNGSGKSNIVDAIAWVLGEQGAKSLRGGKMEDVIFAGTTDRPALGRAEVVLTIDNTDGALPIEYTEVTISRLMYRSGESEYAINGAPCRLLDVQELLSDSGIGREMHVVVGQGQLETVLAARPEDRRAFIEEAAGVLKHRKRKEKALRKLEAMQANLTRLTDLTGELHRQLKPLGRQAEVARRAAVVQADVRDARLRLLADDLHRLRADLALEQADETAARQRRARVEAILREAGEEQARLEADEAAHGPLFAAAAETYYRLTANRDRLQALAELAVDRQRRAAEEQLELEVGRDPDTLERQAAEVRAAHDALVGSLADDRARLTEAEVGRERAEAALAAEQSRLALSRQSAADRREGLARLAGEVAAARSRVSMVDSELARLAAAGAAARDRAAAAQRRFAALEGEIAALHDGEATLDVRYESAAAALAEAVATVDRVAREEREAERDRAALVARREALSLGLDRPDGAGVLLRAGLAGLLGPVSELIQVAPPDQAAVAAALGVAADGVAVRDLGAALAAVRRLRDDDAGRTTVLVASDAGDPRAGWPLLPAWATYAVDLVDAPAELRGSLTALLDRVAVVDDLDRAGRLVATVGGVRAVTRAGDLVGATWIAGGSGGVPSRFEMQTAAEETGARLTEVAHRCERLRFELGAAHERRSAAAAEADAALAELHESDARLAAVAEQLGQHGAAVRAATAEAERLQRAAEEAAAARQRYQLELADLETRLAAAERTDVEDVDAAAEPRLADAARAARQAEVDARLALRTSEERVTALAARADELITEAVAARAAQARAADARARRERAAATAAAVGRVAHAVLGCVDVSVTRADAVRRQLATAAEERGRQLAEVRGRIRARTAELEALTDAVHREEVVGAERRLRVEQLEERVAEEFGLDPQTLLADYGPDAPVPVLADDGQASGETRRFERAEQERRLRSAERALALLGKVNPLALEEYAALQERHRFLSTQLEDLRATRRDLLTVVREVDERVRQVFAEAFADTAREFEQVFAALFPGGEGRLVLTDPDDLLTTGVEVEARPMGKRVKRLSLLSGGERSLAAIALLVAIFRARPSPFYVLDEIEAALDDKNLGRLLDLLTQLGESSQLLVVTHQKRTMEIADALYGVSMRGDGLSAVISQRLREAATA
jgi:chromosome segregation protein